MMANEQRVRKRQSYQMWKRVYRFLMTHDTIEDIMKEIYRVMDNHYAFGTNTHSVYAAESLKLLLEDMREAT